MEISVFKIEGMTCESCVKTITEKASAINDISSVKVSLFTNDIEIKANRKVGLDEVKNVLLSSQKYKVTEASSDSLPQTIVKDEPSNGRVLH